MIAIYGAFLATLGVAWQVYSAASDNPKVQTELLFSRIGLEDSTDVDGSALVRVSNAGYKPVAVMRVVGGLRVDTGAVSEAQGVFSVVSQDVPLRVEAQDFATVTLHFDFLATVVALSRRPLPSGVKARLTNWGSSFMYYPQGFPAWLDVSFITSEGDSVRLVQRVVVGESAGMLWPGTEQR